MAEIQVLDSSTIDKIAAGEVVERPASVVKELVENAIDAGAHAITVEIKEGGIEFIRVTDDGHGIEKSQVKKAFLRHATSKIKSIEDLMVVSSLGFRGEALSSISAVSKVELITKVADDLTGIRYTLEGGVEKDFDEIGAPTGTTFLIRNLFYNTPARRKFLKSPMTEGSYITDLMEHMALSKPMISFKYILNGQTKFFTNGDGKLQAIIYRIYGREIAGEMIPFSISEKDITLSGFLGRPTINRSNRNYENYFVNNRYIKSNILSKAIEEGYKNYLMQHKYPFCVLHLSIPSTFVDVNVHPTKMDVRFSNQATLYAMIADAIADKLSNKDLMPKVDLDTEKEKRQQVKLDQISRPKLLAPEPFEKTRTVTHSFAEENPYLVKTETIEKKWDDSQKKCEKNISHVALNTKNNSGNTVVTGLGKQSQKMEKEIISSSEKEIFFQDNRNSENDKKIETTRNIEPKIVEKEEIILTDEKIEETQETNSQAREYLEALQGLSSNKVIEKVLEKPPVIIENVNQQTLFEEEVLTKEARKKYQIIGQIFETYWLVTYEDKLLLIDQHAAHEKIKYEQIIKKLDTNELYSQVLNPPIIIHVTPKEEDLVIQYMDYFKELGFELESFGGHSYALRSVPLDLYGYHEKELFEEVLAQMVDAPIRGVPDIIKQKIASMACKAAIKGNMKVSIQEANALIDQLLELDNPYHCPHGRPTIISMSKYEIEKKFKRIV